jgi:hypothetical protein
VPDGEPWLPLRNASPLVQEVLQLAALQQIERLLDGTSRFEIDRRQAARSC